MRQILRSRRRSKERVMAYDLEAFIADCRAALSSDPGPNGGEQVGAALEPLLANAEFVRRVCGEEARPGLNVLYEAPVPGFQILAHVNAKPRTSPPHDHGASWAIYGQATGYTDMTEGERLDDVADPDRPPLKPAKEYRLMAGHLRVVDETAATSPTRSAHPPLLPPHTPQPP